MEPTPKRSRGSYVTWSNEERKILTECRIKREKHFNGKNANAAQGWRDLMDEVGPLLGEGKTLAVCKEQWKAITKKYKSFFVYTSGNGTGVENINEDAHDWHLFDIFHQYARNKTNYHPPCLMSSDWGLQTNTTNPTQTLEVPVPSSSTGTTQLPTSSSTIQNARLSTSSLASENREMLRCLKKERKKMFSLVKLYTDVLKVQYPDLDVSGIENDSSDTE